MSGHTIVYEHPLSEQVRTYLRLEHLFNQANYHLLAETSWDHRACLQAIFDLITVLERSDIKNDLAKELEKHHSRLLPLMDIPNVDTQKLSHFLLELQNSIQSLGRLDVRIHNILKNHELFASVRQRSAIPGGTCCFDVPAYHHWLNQSMQRRREELSTWYNQFTGFKHSLALLLKLLRDSADFRVITAPGYYQQDLNSQNVTCQLIRVLLARDSGYYPEISGNKHRISIRFLSCNGTEQRPIPVQSNVQFHLACCAG